MSADDEPLPDRTIMLYGVFSARPVRTADVDPEAVAAIIPVDVRAITVSVTPSLVHATPMEVAPSETANTPLGGETGTGIVQTIIAEEPPTL